MPSSLDHLFSMFIPDVVTLQSQSKPTHPFYVYAEPDPSDEIVTITNLEFARATHRVAHFLRPSRQGKDGEVVGIIALSDTLLYQALVVGLITANMIPFPISPRNSPAAIVNLLHKSSCHRIIATCTTLQPLLAGLQHEIAQVDPDFLVSIKEVPSVAQIYPNLGCETPSCAFGPYPSALSQPSLDDICIYLHSSGSTGFPKAIGETHRAIMQWASNGFIEEMRDGYTHPVAAMALPSFHLSGIYGQLLEPVYGGIPAALYPPTALSPDTLPILPSPDNIIAHTRKTKSGMLMCFPTLLAKWSKSPDDVAFLKTLSFIGFAGGSLPRRLGDALVGAGLKLQAVYGATELGTITSPLPYKEDEQEWEWMRFSDKLDLRWIPQGDGTFECQVLHSANQSVGVENLDDIKGYATSDLFINHPHKKHLWKIVGRKDDVIIHLSGENTVPAPMEDIVMSSPYVAGTVMFGRDHNQAGILIEPTSSQQIDIEDPTQVAELRNKLWPIIEEANSIAPRFSRIFKEMIIFTSSAKPLPRAGKGTVMRKAALMVYSPEIEALYEAIEQPTVTDSVPAPTVWDGAGIQEWLLRLAVDLSEDSITSPDSDIFQQGFDSLSATFLQLRVVGAMRSSQDTAVQRAASGITQNVVYSYRTLSELSAFIARLVRGTENSGVDQKRAIDEMIFKYSSSLSPAGAHSAAKGNAEIVLLTGSTGSLGSQILASLVKDDRVKTIYAFNRPSERTSIAQRHRAIFNHRGLDTSLLDSSKLVFVEGETDQTYLGLPPDVYNKIRNSVTLIVHNAWTLDFNLPVAAFEPHIAGTRNLIDLALSCANPPTFTFTSSITSALSWDIADSLSPDGNTLDASVVASSATGYGQSKFIAEQILAKSGLNATCLRIGQISGALPKGAWATTDWLPILIKTSITLGRLPKANGFISWIDFETVAQAVLDVSFNSPADPERPCSILNLVHPRPVQWNFVMNSVRDILNSKQNRTSAPLELVPFADWTAALEALANRRSSVANLENLPGIRLLDFFGNLSKASVGSVESEFGGIDFATDEIESLSPAVKAARQICPEDVEAWLEYWSSIGFL